MNNYDYVVFDRDDTLVMYCDTYLEANETADEYAKEYPECAPFNVEIWRKTFEFDPR